MRQRVLPLQLLPLLLLLYEYRSARFLCRPSGASLRAVRICQKVWGWILEAPVSGLVLKPVQAEVLYLWNLAHGLEFERRPARFALSGPCWRKPYGTKGRCCCAIAFSITRHKQNTVVAACWSDHTGFLNVYQFCFTETSRMKYVICLFLMKCVKHMTALVVLITLAVGCFSKSEDRWKNM